MADETVDKLTELLETIRGYDDPRRASAEWKQVYKLMGKTDIPPHRFNGVVGMRNVDALAGLISEVSHPEDAVPEQEIDPQVLKKAYQAFRKRSKLTRLDDESQLGHGPFSKGGDASLGAITPPDDWPREVWQALVRQGKLRYLGEGMYELLQ